MTNVRSRRCIDSSSIIAHPVNFDEPFRKQREKSLECDAKNMTYVSLSLIIYITLSIIDMDLLYR